MTTQFDLDSAVAFATGEDVSFINNRGFSIVVPIIVDFDPEPNHMPPSMIDWDSEFSGATVPVFEAA